MPTVWTEHRSQTLAQGDLLPDCWVPLTGPQYGTPDAEEEIEVESRRLIIVTQSCDLDNGKNHLAALCPVYTLDEFESENTGFAKKGHWEQVRKGRVEGLHLLASPTEPNENRRALVVDFRQIFSLPVEYLKRRAGELGDRWRLEPPFLEHFSQAFARFFMRVGLPVSIPPYK